MKNRRRGEGKPSDDVLLSQVQKNVDGTGWNIGFRFRQFGAHTKTPWLNLKIWRPGKHRGRCNYWLAYSEFSEDFYANSQYRHLTERDDIDSAQILEGVRFFCADFLAMVEKGKLKCPIRGPSSNTRFPTKKALAALEDIL